MSASGLTAKEERQMVEACLEAKNNSYSPYSRFRVGCALWTSCGRLFTGCNVENVSYGLCICAERTAYVKAVSEGCRTFKAVAVSSDTKATDVYPCGACRQFMSEFGDVPIYVVASSTVFSVAHLKDLMPFAFTPKALENGQLHHSSVNSS